MKISKSKVLVLGSRGLVGSAITKALKAQGYQNILTPVRSELDLLSQNAVLDYFKENQPEYVFLAAAKVGGIHANDTYPADFIFENLQIQNNVFGAAFKHPVKKLLFLGSSCIYPKECPQPIKEEYLLTGELEKTNEAYAIAKIAGLKMAEYFKKQYDCPFFSIMPTNLYGPNDNFHPENSHVIPGLMTRLSKAKEQNDSVFNCWGTGNPKREFMYVDDLAEACIFIMNYEKELPPVINVGTGVDISIKELVHLIKDIVGYTGKIEFDTSKPDGTMRKLLDVSTLRELGWSSKTTLEEGLISTFRAFQEKI